MAKGVKEGTKRGAYKKKSPEELAEAKEKRVQEAEEILPQFLATNQWSKPWESDNMLQKVYLCSFAGLSPEGSAHILGCSSKEAVEAVKAIPVVAASWSRGQEDIVSLCHIALTQRIRGMTITEIRRTEKADGGVDITTTVKELPPDIDAVKFFLTHRNPQYQDQDASRGFETRLDTLLGRIEGMEMLGS